jgi:thiosulfate reductase/polysulfide reductase chain A
MVSQVRQLSQALNRPDVELVVVDPRFSAAAAKAHHHLAIKPGTDTALILGWIKYLIDNDLYDHDFVERYCLGFTELREHVAPYTLDKTAEVTDLPKAHIAGIAEIMGQAGAGTTIVPGNQLSWYGNDVDRVRAVALLSALLGAVPQDAMDAFDFTSTSKPVDVAQVLGRIRSGETPVVGIWGQNVVQAESPAYFMTKALRDAEFTFCTDIFPSESSLYADIILPEASFLERDDFSQSWVGVDRKIVAGSFQVVEPAFSRRPPFDIVKSLAEASGLGEHFATGSVRDLHESHAGQHGTSLQGLRRAGGVVVQRKPLDEPDLMVAEPLVEGELSGDVDPFVAPEMRFKTPSGKVELASSWLGLNGYSPLPQYTPPMSVPDGFIRLLSGRCPVHTLTRTSGIDWLNHEIGENVLWLSEAAASSYGVKSGQMVRLESPDGLKSIGLIEVLVTPGIREDCCYTSHGFGNLSPLMSIGFHKGLSVSRLLSRSTKDPVSGVCGLHDIFVRIVRG